MIGAMPVQESVQIDGGIAHRGTGGGLVVARQLCRELLDACNHFVLRNVSGLGSSICRNASKARNSEWDAIQKCVTAKPSPIDHIKQIYHGCLKNGWPMMSSICNKFTAAGAP